jgi:hypothetical protein
MADQMNDEQLQKFLASVGQMPVEKRVKLYVRTRDARSEFTKAFEAQDQQYKAILEYIESSLLEQALREGVEGYRTPYGTTYVSEVARYSVGDDTAFTTFLDQLPEDESPYEFFERRISATHVKAYMEAHDGTLPPGLNQFREKVMRVRKSNGK